MSNTDNMNNNELKYPDWCFSYNKESSKCMGTKEMDTCNCGGRESLCSFYDNIRKQGKQKVQEQEYDDKENSMNNKKLVNIRVNNKNTKYSLRYSTENMYVYANLPENKDKTFMALKHKNDNSNIVTGYNSSMGFFQTNSVSKTTYSIKASDFDFIEDILDLQWMEVITKEEAEKQLKLPIIEIFPSDDF